VNKVVNIINFGNDLSVVQLFLSSDCMGSCDTNLDKLLKKNKTVMGVILDKPPPAHAPWQCSSMMGYSSMSLTYTKTTTLI